MNLSVPFAPLTGFRGRFGSHDRLPSLVEGLTTDHQAAHGLGFSGEQWQQARVDIRSKRPATEHVQTASVEFRRGNRQGRARG